MSNDLRELYQDIILDHCKRPRNYRHPDDANRQARGDNPLCGDRVVVYLKLAADGRIEDVAFEGRGCAISTASASLMTELVRGKTIEQAKALFAAFHGMITGSSDENGHGALADDLDDLRVLSGVSQFPTRVKCATLPWHTLNAALNGSGAATTE